MGKLNSSKTDTPNLNCLNIEDVARRLTAAGSHLNPVTIVTEPTPVAQEEFRKFKAVIDHKLTNLAQSVQAIHTQAEAAMKDMRASERLEILGLATQIVVQTTSQYPASVTVEDRITSIFNTLTALVKDAK